MEALLNDINQQRVELHMRINALQEELNDAYEMLSRLDKAEAALKGQSLTVLKMVEPRAAKRKSEPTKTNLTIKDMALLVLKENPNGLAALDILSEINSKFNQSLVRTSLSPQLSRLRTEKLIYKSGKRWILGKSPFLEAKM